MSLKTTKEELLRWSRRLKKEPSIIQSWLDNFQPNELKFVKRLLDHIRFIDKNELDVICKRLYTIILENIPASLEDIVFVSLGGQAKSDKLIAYYFRLNNELPEEMFVDIKDANLSEFRNKHIIYLDDVSGSGKQFSEDWNMFYNSLENDFISSNVFYFAPIFITEQAKDKISKDTKLKIIHIDEFLLTDMNNALKLDSGIFSQTELPEVIKIFTNSGETLYPKAPIGYGNNSLLISFFSNTPNNTLPIIWAKTK